MEDRDEERSGPPFSGEMVFRPGVDDANQIFDEFYREPFLKGKHILGRGHIVTLWNNQNVAPTGESLYLFGDCQVNSVHFFCLSVSGL